MYRASLVHPFQAQARRVYEILRLRVTDRSDPEQYRSYRLAVKNRLNAAHQVPCVHETSIVHE